MGCLNSKPEDAAYAAAAERSKKLDAMNKTDNAADARQIKLLLLGAGESGKSTIFKQLRLIYGTPYPVEERKQMTTVVHSNIISNARLLCQACEKISPLLDSSIKSELDSVPDAEDVVLDAKIGALLKRLWKDAGAQETWRRRAEFQVQDALSWYMAELDRISAADYVPTVDDILRARVRTSGIVVESFEIDKITFAFYDVGGQRNERKKWLNCFDNVTAVIYVVGVNEYDQKLYEDDTVNRMDESLQLFDETSNLKDFKRTNMILFLNKTDLFKEKLKTVPVRIADGPNQRNLDFKGPYYQETPGASLEDCYQAALDYFLKKFLATNKDEMREIYHHFTNATDSQLVRTTFNACKDIILKNNLRGSGFMD